MRARYYDPNAGRFMLRDTWAYAFQNPAELNRYSYAMGNPDTIFDIP
jgi:RHS repeat-associated protein